MMGFFHTSELIAAKVPLPIIPRCGACGLYKKCNSPKMPVAGEGRRKVLLIGEAPGLSEDSKGIPFIGKAGQYLQRVLSGLGVNLYRDCWITNALICHPWERNQKEEKKNRAPKPGEIDACRPNVVRAILELKPEVIILLGGSAVSSVLGWLWKEDVGQISRWIGWEIPCQKLNAWICPANHPSYCMRLESPVTNRLFAKHLKAAFAHKDRPWKRLPNYEERAQVEMVPRQAAHLLREMIRMNRPVAFDYETESLKPDSNDVEIVTCSVSNGVVTVAYPWLGEAVQATKELLRSPLPKIAANLKHEHRWTAKKMGIQVRRWVFDTMVAAHVLDNRPGVCSLKFQSFVLLGQEPWDTAIKPFFQAKGPSERNRVREIEPRQLLKYNSLDSLFEWQIARVQAKKLGVDLFSGLQHEGD